MTKKANLDPTLLRALVDTGSNAAPLEAKLELLHSMRGASAETDRDLDRHLLSVVERVRHDALELRSVHEQLGRTLEQILAPPWYLATFCKLIPGDPAQHALVVHNGVQRVVGFAEGVDPLALAAGDTIFLTHQLNSITRKADGISRSGEMATYERPAGDGRCVLRCRDEEIVADMAAPLRHTALQRGDLVRWERGARMVLEKIESSAGKRHFLEDTPLVARESVGGQDESLDLLLSILTATLLDPASAALYRLGTRNSVLMIGAPGCGKTLMARVVAAEIARISGKRCRFAVVKPAEWESPWVGETEQNIRNCFSALREATADGFCIIFLDEIESIGRTRGHAVGFHSDKSLAALLAELDGFGGRDGIAVIAASNRKDLIDPALLSRLSDFEIQVRRPTMDAARAIFAIHLAEDLPYSPNGAAAARTRDELIDAAVSRWYAPNADNHLCTVRFRDAKERRIEARELASGRTFEQVCRSARWSAFRRHAAGGPPGLQVTDIEDAISDTFARLASTLTRENLRAHLDDVPQDVDVVAVQPIARKVARPRQFLSETSPLDPLSAAERGKLNSPLPVRGKGGQGG